MRCALALLALATMPAAATTWSCGLSPTATQIVCHAEPEDAAPAPAGAAVTATVRGTAFPLDAARVWVVDLWTPATDMPGVLQLAQATMCYRSPGCKVTWRAREAPPPAAAGEQALRRPGQS